MTGGSPLSISFAPEDSRRLQTRSVSSDLEACAHLQMRPLQGSAAGLLLVPHV